MGEHLSTGKYTFLHLFPFICPSLPSQSKSTIHLFKTLSFNVILFLNVLFINLSLRPSPFAVTWQQEKCSCHFAFSMCFYSPNPPSLFPTLWGSFILTSREFHLPVCVSESIYCSQPSSGRETDTKRPGSSKHTESH